MSETNPIPKEETKTEPKLSMFQLMGESQNGKVLRVFVFMTLLLVGTAFGVFLIGREYIPKLYPNIPRKDAAVYSCGASAVVTHIIIGVFYFWARDYDIKEQQEMDKKKKNE